MTNRSFRICPICNFPDASLFLSATSKLPTKPSQIQITEKYFGLHGDIVKCDSCGFAYIGNNNYVKRISHLYRKMSDNAYLREEKERRLSFLGILKNLTQLRAEKGEILDIGCCTGGLLVEAKRSGWQVRGLDPSIWACRTAQRLHNLNIFNGTLDNFNSKKTTFDAITLLDVLEHVNKPLQTLIKIRSLLHQRGILCIVTPDYGSITSKLFGKKWWGIRLAHLSYFRFQDLQRLFQQTGFRIVKSKTYIRFFSLYYLFIRLFPVIDNNNLAKSFLKKITVPLVFFDTFELYLVKK